MTREILFLKLTWHQKKGSKFIYRLLWRPGSRWERRSWWWQRSGGRRGGACDRGDRSMAQPQWSWWRWRHRWPGPCTECTLLVCGHFWRSTPSRKRSWIWNKKRTVGFIKCFKLSRIAILFGILTALMPLNCWVSWRTRPTKSGMRYSFILKSWSSEMVSPLPESSFSMLSWLSSAFTLWVARSLARTSRARDSPSSAEMRARGDSGQKSEMRTTQRMQGTIGIDNR